MRRKIQKLLYKSFDKILNQRDLLLLNKALKESAELRKEKEVIVDIREKTREGAADRFSPEFTDRVMHHVLENHHDEEILFESLVKVFRPIAIAALLLLISLVFYNMSRSNELSLRAAYAITDVSVEEAFDPIVDLTAE